MCGNARSRLEDAHESSLRSKDMKRHSVWMKVFQIPRSAGP
jgi:hypothetical protein